MTYSKGVEFLEGYPIVSDQVTKQELAVILAELRKILAANVEGDVVELGCYRGTTSLFLQRAALGKSKTLHVYDSFEGLPPKVAADESPLGAQYKAGELSVGKSALINNFKHAGLPLPTIHKAWFDELSPKDLPDQICFAYLDGDFYNSIRCSLELVWPKLTPGAAVVVDDYQHQGLPGAKKAVDEWLKTHTANLQAQESLAIIRPKS